MKNYYQILGLNEDATLEDIKKAYREYALKFHPDKHNGDTFFKARFQEIHEAYQYLINNYNNPKSYNKEANYQSDKKEDQTIQIITFKSDKHYRYANEGFTIMWDIKNANNISIIVKTISEKKVYANLPNYGSYSFDLVENGNIRIILLASNQGGDIKKQIIIKERIRENKWENSFSLSPVLLYFIMIFTIIFILILIISS